MQRRDSTYFCYSKELSTQVKNSRQGLICIEKCCIQWHQVTHLTKVTSRSKLQAKQRISNIGNKALTTTPKQIINTRKT